MTRTEVILRINEIIGRRNQLRSAIPLNETERKVNTKELELLAQHQDDLDRIYNAHLYKLP